MDRPTKPRTDEAGCSRVHLTKNKSLSFHQSKDFGTQNPWYAYVGVNRFLIARGFAYYALIKKES